MKPLAVSALTASVLLCSCAFVTYSACLPDSSPVTVTHGDITFEIARYRYGGSSVTFEDDDADWSSKYTYNETGYVVNMEAGYEHFEIMYDDNIDVEKVLRWNDRQKRRERKDRRRDHGKGKSRGKGESRDQNDVSKIIAMLDRREAVTTCDCCEEAWRTVCGDGLVLLCALTQCENGLRSICTSGFGALRSEFGAMGVDSVDTMCGAFVRACGANSAGEVCADRCDGGGGGDDGK